MRPLVSDWVSQQTLRPVYETQLYHIADIVGVRFVPRIKREMPELERLVSVELKLFDITGVISQCRNNQYFTNASWAAMPDTTIARMRRGTLAQFTDNGIGLLAVGDAVEIVIPAVEKEMPTCPRMQMFRRKFWRYLRKEIIAT